MATSLIELKNYSIQKKNELRTEITNTVQGNPYSEHICIFACGSLGRNEAMQASDLDIFYIWDDTVGNYNESDRNNFIDSLLQNKKLDFVNPHFSKYKIMLKKEQLLDIGSQEEDYSNSFTARMLLLLESTPLFNDQLYSAIIDETIAKYFADYNDHAANFSPLFLMNDIQRYWLTLLLNYEYRRDSSDAPSKKYWKRLKLKYARLLTCYSLIACLYEENITAEYVKRCVLQTPFDRIDSLAKKHPSLQGYVNDIHKHYDQYIELRKKGLEYWEDDLHKADAMNKADCFHDVFIHCFMKEIALTNMKLHGKTEIY